MTPQTRDFLYRGPIGPHVVIELAAEDTQDDDDCLYLVGPPETRHDSKPTAARETRTHQNPEPV